MFESIDYPAMSYMVEELSKEMATVVELAMKPIHERIDRMVQRRTRNLHHPTRRTWRSLNEDEYESVDRHSFRSNWRPSLDSESFYARMDQCMKNALQEYESQNIITTIPTIQSPNKEEMVIGFDNSTDTEDEESDSKMPESNVSSEDEHELSNDEGEAEVDQEKLSEEEPNDEEIDASGEHVLVSNQALNVQIHVGDAEQRENIFHTRCHVKDEVCSMIIDGGSCTNVASVIMVENLGLPILKLPKPYRLQWLNETGVIKAMKQMKVPFRIGKYEDYVKLREESEPKKKKKKRKKKQKKLKRKDIMQWSFLAMKEGFVFDPGIDDSDLRTNPSQEEGNDAARGPNIHDHIQAPIGSITRARAKKFKNALHGLIQEVWAQELSKKPIGVDGPSSPRVVNLIEVNGLDFEDT